MYSIIVNSKLSDFSMATPDVFRPSNGPLLVRDAGMYGSKEDPLDKYRKQSPAGRPTTQSGYRFGQLSHNSFFTRHNPHPHRVRHIKGKGINNVLI